VKRGRPADINDLCEFVVAAAEEANDPVYSRLRTTQDISKASNSSEVVKGGNKGQKMQYLPKSVSVHSTTSVSHSSTPQGCLKYGGQHGIWTCDRLKELSIDARIKYGPDL